MRQLTNSAKMAGLTLTLALTLALAGLSAGSLLAGDPGKAVIDDKAPVEASPWTVCNVFHHSTLYESEKGFIREVSLNGRYHGQAISQSENDGGVTNGFNQWQHRRFRLGMDIAFAGNVTLKTSANISNGGGAGRGLTRGPFFDDWDEFYIDWEPSDDFYIQVGKQKQKITREFSTSSKKILTIERSHITNEVSDKKPWGVTVGFKIGGIKHEVGAWVTGAYNNGFGGTQNIGTPNYPNFNSRGALSYRLEAPVTDNIDLHFDYLYVNNSSGTVNGRGNAANGFDAPYEHTIALGSESEFGQFGLITDLIFAANREAHAGSAIPAGNDTWGAVILPYYNITDKLQVVGRYAYMDEGRNQRTQRFNVRQGVQSYHTFYAGINYYICDHNLKLMAGYEYATGQNNVTGAGITSDTWMFGIRTYF